MSTPWGLAAKLALCAAVTLSAAPAVAQEIQVHGNLGVIHAFGNLQQTEFGVGVGAAVAAELRVARIVGFQVEASGLGFSDGTPPGPPTLTPSGGYDFGAMAGVRIHPLGRLSVAGLWIDGNGGVAITGGGALPSFDLHVGYDFRIGHGRLDLGPFLGDTHIVAPSNAVVPGDAHILWIGLHVAFGASRLDRDRD